MCGSAQEYAVSDGRSYIAASYYDKNGELIGIRRANNADPAYEFKGGDEYTEVTETWNSDKLTVTQTTGTDSINSIYDPVTGKMIGFSENAGTEEQVSIAAGHDEFGRTSTTEISLNGAGIMNLIYGTNCAKILSMNNYR